jgi:S1-C subfamily serine protease
VKRIFSLSFLGVCAILGSAGTTLLAPHLASPVLAQNPSSSPPATSLSPAGSDVLRLGDRFEVVAKRVAPTVVAIDATKPAATSSNATTSARPVEESGSGVLVRFDGQRGVLVLTNNHVVANASTSQITVSLADGRVLKPAYVWADPESDIALLRMEGADNQPAATLGDSDTARVGQWVLAFGSPFGLNQTVTHGIISARERGQVSLGSTIRIKDFLQTDAAINPGSSGGPLVNLDGEVIGINTAIASHSGSNSGVAFSIPINLVKRVSGQLLEKGAVSRGYLGMQLAQSFEAADALKLGLDRVQGALVETVYPKTPAEAAGLRTKDVVLQVDNVTIRNENHLINLITGLQPGQRITMQIWREGKVGTLEAVVGDWSKDQGRFRPSK